MRAEISFFQTLINISILPMNLESFSDMKNGDFFSQESFILLFLGLSEELLSMAVVTLLNVFVR